MRNLIVAALIAITAPAALAQATPEATLARFVELANAGELTSAEGQAILTGEAKEMATNAKSALPSADKIIPVGKDKAAARFVLRSSSGEEADAYFYLSKTAQGWAVSAYRAMVKSGMDMMLLAELKKRKTLTPDEEYQKRNLQLVLSTDSKLRSWFATNRTALEGLAQKPETSDTLARIKELGIQGINVSNAVTDIAIGGALDNTVGFLRPGPKGPPAIDPSRYIWIEDLGGGWYLYRTT